MTLEIKQIMKSNLLISFLIFVAEARRRAFLALEALEQQQMQVECTIYSRESALTGVQLSGRLLPIARLLTKLF